MSLIRRIKDRAFEDLVAASEARELQREQELRFEAQRINVIKDQLHVVAAQLDESLKPLMAVASQSRYYFVLGDLVIMVQPFAPGGQKPDPSLPKQLAFEYCAYLVIVDERHRLVTRRIGMLKLLDFSGIAKALNQVPADYIVNAEEVAEYLNRP